METETKTIEVKSTIEESEYKGNATLIIKNGAEDRYPFSFGIKKAKLMVEHIDIIKKFVAMHG